MHGRIALLALALSFAGSSEAQNRPRPRVLGQEWISLFNGEDLTGWKKVGKESWEVVGGAIYGRGITQEYGYLATERSYRDFHLSLRFKCEADGNSRRLHPHPFSTARRPESRQAGRSRSTEP